MCIGGPVDDRVVRRRGSDRRDRQRPAHAVRPGRSRPLTAVDIRPARLPDDADQIIALFGETLRFHADRWPRELRAGDPSGLRSQLDELAAADSGFRVAEQDGVLVGLISANLLEQPTGGMNRYDGPLVWIGDIVVTETARGRGIGGMLLAEVEAWARSRGAAHVLLNTHYGNDAALALYERNGYRRTDIRLRKDL